MVVALAEDDLADVDGHRRVGIDGLGDHRPPRAVDVVRARAVAQELQVTEVRARPLERLHGLDGRARARAAAEVDAVDVRHVRQAELVVDPGQRLDDLPRRHAVADHLVVELPDVAPPLPVLDAAGVHDLDGVALGGGQQPGDVVARPLGPPSRIACMMKWLLPMVMKAPLSRLGMSSSSSWVWRATSGAVAASITVV
jgi:hypothetical protein